jgi:hypothetical protein
VLGEVLQTAHRVGRRVALLGVVPAPASVKPPITKKGQPFDALM